MKLKSRTLTKVKSMPSRKLKNHIRAHRKRSWLSQSEVAMLVGSQTGASVSRHECFRRLPTLPTGLAYEIIFGIPMRELFPGLFEDAQKATLARASTLAEKLRASPTVNHAVHKLRLLQEILARSKSANQHHPVA
jgi:DNA-binding XRE family transcriptional regulator